MQSPSQKRVDIGFDLNRRVAVARVRVFLEIGHISQTLYHGNIWSLDFLLHQVIPAEVVEPPMLLNIVDP
jgi:hypothetical protein